jgi:hypothetical protein
LFFALAVAFVFALVAAFVFALAVAFVFALVAAFVFALVGAFAVALAGTAQRISEVSPQQHCHPERSEGSPHLPLLLRTPRLQPRVSPRPRKKGL